MGRIYVSVDDDDGDDGDDFNQMIVCIKVPAEDAGYGALEQAAVLNVEVNKHADDGDDGNPKKHIW